MSIYLPIAEMNVNIFLIIFIGMSIGILSGIFGVGGGFLMTPLLIFLGIPPVVAVGSEAPHVLATSVSGVIAHWRKKNVDIKMGIFLLSGGLLGSTVGVNLFNYLKNYGQIDLVIQLLFVFFLGFVGFSMAFESARTTIKQYRARSTKRKKLHQHSWFHGLPFKVRFHRSKLYIKCNTSRAYWIYGWYNVSDDGCWRWIYNDTSYGLYIRNAHKCRCWNVFVSNNICNRKCHFFQSYINYNVDVVLSALMIFGGVIGAQIGVILGSRLKAEYLRGILAILVLAVCGKIFTDLVLKPNDLFSLVIL